MRASLPNSAKNDEEWQYMPVEEAAREKYFRLLNIKYSSGG